MVTAVGARPVIGWLTDSGLGLDDGVAVDGWLRAAPGVVAVGDLAARWSERHQARMRLEQWDEVSEGARRAVHALLQPDLSDARSAPLAPHDPVPQLRSRQFGHTVEFLGVRGPADTAICRERAESFSVFWHTPDGRLTAALVIDDPDEASVAYAVLDRGVKVDLRPLSDASVPLAQAVLDPRAGRAATSR